MKKLITLVALNLMLLGYIISGYDVLVDNYDIHISSKAKMAGFDEGLTIGFREKKNKKKKYSKKPLCMEPLITDA